MAKYSYTARNDEGLEKKGEISASSKKELAQILRQQGLLLTFAEAEEEKKGFKLFSTRVSTIEKIIFTRNLFLMIKAGLSILRALDILVKQTSKKGFKGMILEIKRKIEKGSMLADSLAAYPKIFSPFYISMIKMGEMSGQLEKVLSELAIQMKKDRELMVKVRSALLYPSVVLMTMLAVGVIMIVFVLPQLTEIFVDFDVELPLTTRMLIGFSYFIQSYGVFVGIGTIALAIGIFFFSRTKNGKKITHAFNVKMFILGPIIRKINVARFARNMSTLLRSGIPITKALQITRDVLGNLYYKRVMDDAINKVKKGIKIVDILEKEKNLFPPLVTQMVMVGEETGSLDEILNEIADFYEKEVTETMNNLSAILEPVLMVILGLAVGVVAVSVVSPIYSLMEHF
ncbi:MAG: type II secretion system F family protein [Parcubacteria group bacterium]|nr:type II secretion system F family protein [Parcubacteria group bacterium]